MGVRCPECGREYDVTLFQYGRTIHCTCGAQVGLEHRTGIPRREGRPAFIADVMLGKLARWLRILGYDTAWEEEIDDEQLVTRARREGRMVLTRDRRLPKEWRVDNVVLITSDEPLEQLRQVVETLDLDWREGLFSRCSVCNTPLVRAGEESVEQAVPEAVREEKEEFAWCPTCRRVYWSGGHVERMLRRLEEVLGG